MFSKSVLASDSYYKHKKAWTNRIAFFFLLFVYRLFHFVSFQIKWIFIHKTLSHHKRWKSNFRINNAKARILPSKQNAFRITRVKYNTVLLHRITFLEILVGSKPKIRSNLLELVLVFTFCLLFIVFFLFLLFRCFFFIHNVFPFIFRLILIFYIHFPDAKRKNLQFIVMCVRFFMNIFFHLNALNLYIWNTKGILSIEKKKRFIQTNPYNLFLHANVLHF